MADQPLDQRPELPRGGDAILREVERLRQAPIRVQCLGMSLGWLLLLALAAWLAWHFLH